VYLTPQRAKQTSFERENMDKLKNEIQLLGVPHYLQGDMDSLCVYYAMSMLIVSLIPDFLSKIHEPPKYKRQGSPVLQVLRQSAKNERKFKEDVGDWCLNGMTTTRATLILNEFCSTYYGERRGKFFIRRKVKCRRMLKRKYNRKLNSLEKIWKVSDIFESIANYLPVIISGGGIQGHAVVAVGSGSEDKSRWIYYHDPAIVGQVYNDDHNIFIDDCEAIIPNAKYFREYRPTLIVTRGKKPERKEWNPKG
jgi:hypothetical protein